MASKIFFLLQIIALSCSLALAATNTTKPDCYNVPPILDPKSGSGHVEKLGGMDTYVNGPPQSKRAIILASDVYGYSAPNLRKIADKVAAAGYYVVVPDFFFGDPYDPTNTSRPNAVWLLDHSTDKGFQNAKLVVKDLKKRGKTAIGAAGFCWGAKAVVQLAKPEFVKAVVLLHPSYIVDDDINNVKVPIALLGAEFDHPDRLEGFSNILTAKSEVNSLLKIYPGVCHGWTVKYNVTDPSAIKSANEAHTDMLKWFNKYVICPK